MVEQGGLQAREDVLESSGRQGKRTSRSSLGFRKGAPGTGENAEVLEIHKLWKEGVGY